MFRRRTFAILCAIATLISSGPISSAQEDADTGAGALASQPVSADAVPDGTNPLGARTAPYFFTHELLMSVNGGAPRSVDGPDAGGPPLDIAGRLGASSATMLPAGEAGALWAVGDLDGDGRTEIVRADRALAVFANVSSNAALASLPTLGASAKSIVLADLAGDGTKLVVVSLDSGTIGAYRYTPGALLGGLTLVDDIPVGVVGSAPSLVGVGHVRPGIRDQVVYQASSAFGLVTLSSASQLGEVRRELPTSTARAVVVGNFDADDRDEIGVLHASIGDRMTNMTTWKIVGLGLVKVRENVSLPLSGNAKIAATAADVDLDGIDDVIAMGEAVVKPYTYTSGGTYVSPLYDPSVTAAKCSTKGDWVWQWDIVRPYRIDGTPVDGNDHRVQGSPEMEDRYQNGVVTIGAFEYRPISMGCTEAHGVDELTWNLVGNTIDREYCGNNEISRGAFTDPAGKTMYNCQEIRMIFNATITLGQIVVMDRNGLPAPAAAQTFPSRFEYGGVEPRTPIVAQLDKGKLILGADGQPASGGALVLPDVLFPYRRGASELLSTNDRVIDLGASALQVVAGNLDNDGMVVTYLGSDLSIEDSVPVLVIAAPPSIAGVNLDHLSCGSSYGRTASDASSAGTSIDKSEAFGLGIETEVGVLGATVGAEVALKAILESSKAFENARSRAITTTEVTGCEQDYVVAFTSLARTHKYRILQPRALDAAGEPLSFTLREPLTDPNKPVLTHFPLSEFNSRAGPSRQIGTDVFHHVVGDPRTYPTRADRDAILARSGESTDDFLEGVSRERLAPPGVVLPPALEGLESMMDPVTGKPVATWTSIAVGQGSGSRGITYSLENERTRSVSSASGMSIDASLSVGTDVDLIITKAKVAVKALFSGSYTNSTSFSVTEGRGVAYTGTIGDILDADDYKEHFYEAGLFVYNHRPVDGAGFMVMNWWVENYNGPGAQWPTILDAVELDEPAQNAALGRSVEFRWSPLSGVERYELEWSEVPDFGSVAGSTQMKGVAWKTSAFPNGHHYWRVRGINGDMEPGPWSEPRHFRVGSVPPSAPEVDVEDALIRWTPVKGEGGVRAEDATSYRILFSAKNAPGVRFQEVVVPAPAVGAGSARVPADLPAGDHVAWVRAENAAGPGPWSAPTAIVAPGDGSSPGTRPLGSASPILATNLGQGGVFGTLADLVAFPGLPPARAVAWGNVDADDADELLLLVGSGIDEGAALLYDDAKPGARLLHRFDDARYGAVAFADMDNDGTLEIILADADAAREGAEGLRLANLTVHEGPSDGYVARASISRASGFGSLIVADLDNVPGSEILVARDRSPCPLDAPVVVFREADLTGACRALYATTDLNGTFNDGTPMLKAIRSIFVSPGWTATAIAATDRQEITGAQVQLGPLAGQIVSLTLSRDPSTATVGPMPPALAWIVREGSEGLEVARTFAPEEAKRDRAAVCVENHGAYPGIRPAPPAISTLERTLVPDIVNATLARWRDADAQHNASVAAWAKPRCASAATPIAAEPSIADVDGDGTLEVVLWVTDMVAPAWPVVYEDAGSSYARRGSLNVSCGSTGAGRVSVAAGELDGAPGHELACIGTNGDFQHLLVVDVGHAARPLLAEKFLEGWGGRIATGDAEGKGRDNVLVALATRRGDVPLSEYGVYRVTAQANGSQLEAARAWWTAPTATSLLDLDCCAMLVLGEAQALASIGTPGIDPPEEARGTPGPAAWMQFVMIGAAAIAMAARRTRDR